MSPSKYFSSSRTTILNRGVTNNYFRITLCENKNNFTYIYIITLATI